MQRPGRNDPCPCGSGQKYKRCCAERERSDELLRLQWRAAVNALGDYMVEHAPPLFLTRFERHYWLDWYEHRDEAPFAGFRESEFYAYNKSYAALLCPQPDRGPSWLRLYLDSGPEGLAPESLRLLESAADAPLDYYEVVSVSPSGTVRLRSITGVTGSGDVDAGVVLVPYETEPGELVATRLLTLPGGRTYMAGEYYAHASARREALTTLVHEVEGELEDVPPEARPAAALRSLEGEALCIYLASQFEESGQGTA